MLFPPYLAFLFFPPSKLRSIDHRDSQALRGLFGIRFFVGETEVFLPSRREAILPFLESALRNGETAEAGRASGAFSGLVGDLSRSADSANTPYIGLSASIETVRGIE